MVNEGHVQRARCHYAVFQVEEAAAVYRPASGSHFRVATAASSDEMVREYKKLLSEPLR